MSSISSLEALNWERQLGDIFIPFKDSLDQTGVHRPTWRFHLISLPPPSSHLPAPLSTPQRKISDPGESVHSPGPNFQTTSSHIHPDRKSAAMKASDFLEDWREGLHWQNGEALRALERDSSNSSSVATPGKSPAGRPLGATWKDTALWMGQQQDGKISWQELSRTHWLSMQSSQGCLNI